MAKIERVNVFLEDHDRDFRIGDVVDFSTLNDGCRVVGVVKINEVLFDRSLIVFQSRGRLF